MRLTLRTMLAYLDDILEPNDADDIGKKIAESDFATSLVHRTRDCVRRMRLGTPPLQGKGLAVDPNSVAEYLDNTLEADRVPEFEKVCLESDVHLAELASCHQILTLVLGEPAEIDPASRERMYQAIIHADQKTKASEAAAVSGISTSARPAAIETTTAAALAENGKRARPEVPDYLRESEKSRRWPLAATIAIAAIVTLVLLLVAGPRELRETVARWTGNLQPDVAEEPTAPDKKIAPVGDESIDAKDTPEGEEPPADEAEGAPTTEEAAATTESLDAATRGPAVDAPGVEPAEPEMTDDEAARSGDIKLPSVVPPTEGDADLEQPPVPDERPVAPEVEPADAAAPPLPSEEMPEEGADETATEPRSNPIRPAPKPLDIGAAAGEEMGRYLAENQVALVFDRTGNDWRRLSPRAVVAAGDQVLSLPSFRQGITLSNGITVQASGPALINLEGLDENAVPVIGVEFGRLTMVPAAKRGSQLVVRFGDRDVILAFSDVQSTLALEVGGLLHAGKDPESGAVTLAVDLYATSGQIEWIDDKGKHELRSPEHVSLTPQSLANLPQGEVPAWVNGTDVSLIDQKAAASIERELTPDRPLSLSFKELSQNRRAEVRSLAIRSLGYMGQFDAYVSALNDPDQKASWSAQIESLRAAMARGPKVAAQVRETFEKQRGPEAPALYRMLWGYTADQLKAGDAEKLVDYLDHDSLDMRVLSFYNLQDITGLSLLYRPEYPPARRRPQVLKWKEKLRDGKIVPPAPATK